MGKFIQISDADLILLIELYKSRMAVNDETINKLKEQISVLEYENMNLDDRIWELKLLSEYDVNWKYEDKVKFALNKHSVPLSVNEIIAFLKICGDTGMEDKVKNLSSILNEKTKEGVFSRSQVGDVFKYEMPNELDVALLGLLSNPETIDDLPF